jgi:hypothetical protein
MFNKIAISGIVIVTLILPSIAVAKTFIPVFYQCNFDKKEGKLWCATSCVDTKTGKLVHVSPAICRATPGMSKVNFN